MNIRDIFIQFVKFGVVGLFNTVASYSVYALLVYRGLPYLIASIFSFIVGVLNSYLWNKRFVFKNNADENRSSVRIIIRAFFAYLITGLVLSNILLVVFVVKMSIDKYLAKVFTLLITVPMNFLISKFWTYRGKQNV